MLRTSLAALVVALVSLCSASAQTTLGIKGSLQIANEKFSTSNDSFTGDNVVGFQAGLLLKAPINEQFSIRPQLLYSTKGFGISANVLGVNNSARLVFNYLEVPIQLAYSLEVGQGNVVVGAGPYVAYALNGKSTVTVNGQTETEDIEFGSASSQKRFDFGLNLSVGYELSTGLGLSAYYSPGLANLTESRNGVDVNIRNTAFGLSLGYFFGGNR